MYYISGRISDETREKELENLRRFVEKETELTEQGIEVFNPGSPEEVKEGWTWEEYLARDIKFIFENKPTLYMLTGWEQSRGARLEYQVAKLLSLPIIYE